MTGKLWQKIVLCSVVCVALGSLSGLSTVSEINSWYQTIQKPSWNPPSYIFGPVWTLLYLFLGVAVARIWHLRPSTARNVALVTFAIQFFLNLIWSPIFFGMHNLFLALVVILALLLAILATMRLFSKLDNPAMLLLIPYLAWVTFASYLTYTIFHLNS